MKGFAPGLALNWKEAQDNSEMAHSLPLFDRKTSISLPCQFKKKKPSFCDPI